MGRVLATSVLLFALAVRPGAEVWTAAVLTGSAFRYAITAGDSWSGLAARFGVSAETLAARNGRRADAILQPGEELLVDARHIAVRVPATPLVLNVPQRMVFIDDGVAVTGFPVAVGRRSWPTPLGAFRVIEKERNPTWDVPASIQAEMRRLGHPVHTRVPPGPNNPLGAFFIRLSIGGVGLHGTNAPASIYRFATHGCIRLAPENIAALYGRVEVGTTGISLYEPVLLTEADGHVWLEVHRDAYGRAPAPLARAQALAAALGATDRVDWQLAAEVIRTQQGIAIPVGKAKVN